MRYSPNIITSNPNTNESLSASKSSVFLLPVSDMFTKMSGCVLCISSSNVCCDSSGPAQVRDRLPPAWPGQLEERGGQYNMMRGGGNGTINIKYIFFCSAYELKKI